MPIKKRRMRGIIVLKVALVLLTACDSKEPLDENGSTDTNNFDTGTGTEPIVPIDNIHEAVTGKTFIWEITTRNWSVPKGSAEEFGQYMQTLMFQITSALEDGSMTFFTGTVDSNGNQDPCTTTVDIQAAITENPSFQTTPVDFLTYAENLNIENPADQRKQASLYDMSISGSFVQKADGTVGIRKGELKSIIDFRELYPLFNLITDPTPQKICDQTSDYNASCEACPDGEPLCLRLEAGLISVDEEVNKSVSPMTSTCFN